jgi:hypothetical protein
MFTLKSKFDFKISVDKHIVALAPGKQISIKVRVEKIRGKPQPVSLDVNTRWESVGLSAQVLPPVIDTSQPWEATMMIRAAPTTPPSSYLFLIRGRTEGTFNTSEDAVTVIVDPKAEQREDEPDNMQPQQSQPANAGNPSFDLDKLFATKPEEQKKAGAKNPSANSSGTLWVVGFLVGFAILFAILNAAGIFNGGGGEGYKCTCQNGSSCTKNSDCPYFASGVPGVCGCPVR